MSPYETRGKRILTLQWVHMKNEDEKTFREVSRNVYKRFVKYHVTSSTRIHRSCINNTNEWRVLRVFLQLLPYYHLLGIARRNMRIRQPCREWRCNERIIPRMNCHSLRSQCPRMLQDPEYELCKSLFHTCRKSCENICHVRKRPKSIQREV